jgi:hypothetical protein
MTAPDTDTLAGLHETLGGVTVPNIMHGDNLAITLCTAYDNPDQDADEETGWTPDAIAGQEAVLAAIRDHYDPAIKCAIALRAQAAKDKARIERLEAALREIAGIKEREKNCYPPDWREQIAACPECHRYKDHPIQRGICDDHRKPIYAQEDHNRHETKILGYRAMDIARAALEDRE